MKKLLFLSSLLLMTAFSAAAQETTEVFNLTAGTPLNLLAVPAVVSHFSVINSSTNVAILRFYDSATNTTNYVQAPYVSYSSYATNFDVVFTNQTGVLVTNTFKGLYTAPTSNAASTNTRPVIYTLGVPGSGAAEKDVRILPIRGLTALSTQDAVVSVTHTSN